MTDTPRKRGRQAVLGLGDLQTFGLKPTRDPKLGYKLYMWDTMFPRDDKDFPLLRYTVQETAKLFFGRTSDWLRWRYRPTESGDHPNGYFVLNGVVLEPKRTEAGNRYYTLADIERMAYALVENSAIDPEQLFLIIQTILLQAKLNHIIGEEASN